MSDCWERLFRVLMFAYAAGADYRAFCRAGRILGCLHVLVSGGWNCFRVGIATPGAGKSFHPGCSTSGLRGYLALVGMGVLIFLNVLRWNSNIRYISRRIISVNMSDIFSQFIIMI